MSHYTERWNGLNLESEHGLDMELGAPDSRIFRAFKKILEGKVMVLGERF